MSAFLTIKNSDLHIDGSVFGAKATKVSSRSVTDAIKAGIADAASFATSIIGNGKLPADRRDKLLRSVAHVAGEIWTGSAPAGYFRKLASQRANRREVVAEHVAAMPIDKLYRTAAELRKPSPKLYGSAARIQASIDASTPEVLGLVDAELRKRAAASAPAPARAVAPTPARVAAPAKASAPKAPARPGWGCFSASKDPFQIAMAQARTEMGPAASNAHVRARAYEIVQA